jgi:hypothetical protein
MNTIKTLKSYALYTLLGVVLFTSCKEEVVVEEIQKVEIKIDTTYTYTYKVKREDNFFDIHKTTEKYKLKDTIKVLY